MNTIDLTGIDGQKITIDLRKIVAIEDNRNRTGRAPSTLVYVIAVRNPFCVVEAYNVIREKVFPEG